MSSTPPPPAILLERTTSRAKWGHKVEFVLSCVGYSVGLGNVWRFPYLAYKNGGAAFVLAYLLLQITIGKPMYFMEMAMGQYSGKGPVRLWDMNPAARGVGMSMCIVSFVITVYYNVLMAYILHYFFASMQTTLPWSECKSTWKNCITDRKLVTNVTMCTLRSTPESNCTCSGDETIDFSLGFPCQPKQRSASDMYFYDEVIQQSKSLAPGDIGEPNWHLTWALLLAWIIVIACVINGVKSTGKVVYFTATFPYVVLAILLIRGATLDGSILGVEFFLVPKWAELGRLQMWLDALGQMFFSLGLSMGGIISASSYSEFGNNIYVDSLIISTMDVLTSLLAGCVIFTTFGHISKTTGINIAEVASSNYGLAFVAYPEALSQLPVPQLWSAMFFFMLLTLGLDSEFALFETFLTYFEDDFRIVRRNKLRVRLLVGAVCFLIGIAFVTPAGIYLMTIFDTYGAAYPLIALSAFEVISVMWVYGAQRFFTDCEYMLGKKPKFLPFWYFSLAMWAPLVMTIMAVLTLASSETPKYVTGRKFPGIVMFGCWFTYGVAMLPVVLWFLMHANAVYRQHGYTSFKEFCIKLTQPSPRWGPADGTYALALSRNQTVWADVCPNLVGVGPEENPDYTSSHEMSPPSRHHHGQGHISFSTSAPLILEVTPVKDIEDEEEKEETTRNTVQAAEDVTNGAVEDARPADVAEAETKEL